MEPALPDAVMVQIIEIIAGVQDGKPVDWEALDPSARVNLERHLRACERELKIRGDRESAALFRVQLDRAQLGGEG